LEKLEIYRFYINQIIFECQYIRKKLAILAFYGIINHWYSEKILVLCSVVKEYFSIAAQTYKARFFIRQDP